MTASRFTHAARLALAGLLVMTTGLPALSFAQDVPGDAQEQVVDAGKREVVTNAGVRVNLQQGTPFAEDFVFGPGRFIINLAPGEEQTVEVEVTSRMRDMYEFVFENEDFAAGAGAESTQLYGTATGPYSAKNWIHPAVPAFELAHGEHAYIPVTISIPPDADPGDHYGALLLKRGLKPRETSAPGVSVVSRVGIVFIISVKGPVEQNARLTSLTSRSKLYWDYPAYLQLTAKNDGTVFAAPSGTIQIRNILGLVVDEIPVQDWIVLRNSSRSFVTEWRPRFALGRYTASTNLSVYGEPGELLTVSFWMIPALPVLIAILAIFLVSFIVQVFFSRFEIKRKNP